VLFVAISATFFASLGSRTGVDTSSADLRAKVSPLNQPRSGTPVAVAQASRDASVDAFHLAAIVTSVLLLAGAGVNYVGLREGTGREAEEDMESEREPGADAGGHKPPEPSTVG
jgi:methyl coenzyme M reductase subunit C-like uncharacterized protein (methanogenesis marker protein 7)